MTRKEANEKLGEFMKHLKHEVSLDDVDKIMDFIEDYEEGLGMYPTLNKKGKFLWDEPNESSEPNGMK